ncbi:MAG: hypothetical protein J6X55_04050, partial [Victivallales bacterium]|nr:hypothetical protein [Victivallales bacterium]
MLFLLVTMVSVYASETLPTYISAINDGRLSEAKQLLLNAIENEGTSILDKAIAYIHLGTVQFRLGEEDFRQAFETSEKWFQEALSVATDIKPVQQEYSILLFQRANCFISACENELAKSKLQGIVPIPFKLIKDYISPAEADLQKAKSDYPVSQKEDLLLLSLELQLAKFHIWTLTEQAEMAEKAGQEALTLAETALGETFLAPDIHAKLLLRYATALVEVKGQGKENLKKALELLAEGMEKPCGNVEINSALISLWGKLLLMSDASEADLKNAEERLLAATETLEQLRASNVDSMDFMARKAYFSSRTSLYETLVELHARQNKPFEMLKAINRMRSRSIQDYVNNQTGKDEPTTEEQLCQILREGDGMLVAYFIATDTVWIITYTEAGGKISHTMRSGQEIVYLATQTLNVFSSVQHLQGYFRFGSSYRLVPEAILAANILYKELFATAHEEFTKRKLVHLYVLPHNILNYFPFGALFVLVNDSNALASMYVADTGLSITYLPSLSAIMDSGKISLTSNDTMVLARGTYSYPAYYKNNPANPDDPAAQPLNLSNVPSEGQFVSQILQTKPQ